jgi:hypothetical protein
MLNQMLFTSSYWTPASIPTVFWYDAADSSTITATNTVTNEVTNVVDKSGNNRTLVRAGGQTGPLTRTRTLNNLNVLEWSTSHCLQNAAFTHNQANTPLNIAIVTQVDAAPAIQCFFMAGSTSTLAGKRLSVRSATSGLLEILGGDGVATSSLFCGTYIRTQPNIVLIKFNAANSACRMNGSSVATTGSLGTNAFSILSWGHNEGESADLIGYLGEMIAFTDNTNQEIVEGYLAWKWNLTGNLPSGHPYKTTAPRL